MQYKWWVARHGIVIPVEESLGIFNETEHSEMDYDAESDFFEDEDEEEENGDLAEWLKEWSKKEPVSEKIRRVAKK